MACTCRCQPPPVAQPSGAGRLRRSRSAPRRTGRVSPLCDHAPGAWFARPPVAAAVRHVRSGVGRRRGARRPLLTKTDRRRAQPCRQQRADAPAPSTPASARQLPIPRPSFSWDISRRRAPASAARRSVESRREAAALSGRRRRRLVAGRGGRGQGRRAGRRPVGRCAPPVGCRRPGGQCAAMLADPEMVSRQAGGPALAATPAAEPRSPSSPDVSTDQGRAHTLHPGMYRNDEKWVRCV